MQLPRRKQREILLQLLFSFEVANGSEAEAIPLMMEMLEVSKKNLYQMKEELQGIISKVEALDAILGRVSMEYSLERISLMDKAILRIGIFELYFQKEEPAIVIEEALRLSKKFSSPESGAYIHAILDEVTKSETVANRGSS